MSSLLPWIETPILHHPPLATPHRNPYAIALSDMAVPLDDAACTYLLACLAHDLDLTAQHPEVSGPVSPFFETMPVSSLRLDGIEFLSLAERLFASMPDVDTYFSCLPALHKARLKFER